MPGFVRCPPSEEPRQGTPHRQRYAATSRSKPQQAATSRSKPQQAATHGRRHAEAPHRQRCAATRRNEPRTTPKTTQGAAIAAIAGSAAEAPQRNPRETAMRTALAALSRNCETRHERADENRQNPREAAARTAAAEMGRGRNGRNRLASAAAARVAVARGSGCGPQWPKRRANKARIERE